MSYKVIQPLVVIKHEDGKSGDFYGYTGAIVPDGHNDKRCRQLVKEGFLEVVKEDADTASAGDTIEDVLAAVGDDKTKAAAAIDAEKASKNRSRLLAKLQAIVDA